MGADMEYALSRLQTALCDILGADISLYLYGSVPMGDFRLGWSDIDLLCVCAQPFTKEKAEELVFLRQKLLEKEPDNPYYRSFEGMLTSERAMADDACVSVYWGTSGQRLIQGCPLDVFSRYELKTSSVLRYGKERLHTLPVPTYPELREGVQAHYDCIRKYAARTSNPLYMCGWMLDIARCLYTLEAGTVISKTDAAKWALANRLCPAEETLHRVLRVREDPLSYKNDPAFTAWASGIGDDIQAFADRLEDKLKQTAARLVAERCTEC